MHADDDHAERRSQDADPEERVHPSSLQRRCAKYPFGSTVAVTLQAIYENAECKYASVSRIPATEPTS
jgi:hypothetical protein